MGDTAISLGWICLGKMMSEGGGRVPDSLIGRSASILARRALARAFKNMPVVKGLTKAGIGFLVRCRCCWFVFI